MPDQYDTGTVHRLTGYHCVKIKKLHDWNISPQQASKLQRELNKKLVLHDALTDIKQVAGVDVGFENEGKTTRAAVVVLDFPSLQFNEVSISQCKTSFPYIPGLLSFRELPAVLKAVEKLKRIPDLFLCDGQGYAHPRRFGIACHLGVITDIPSLGVGKTRLIGQHKAVTNKKGAWQPLMDDRECIGAVLRTRQNVKPVYISVGHRISLETSIKVVMQCTTRFKLPETTRWAHKYASNTLKLA